MRIILRKSRLKIIFAIEPVDVAISAVLLTEDNEFIAFGSIQTFNFPNNCYRLLSRTYYNPKYRNIKNNYNYNEKTPAIYILEDQLLALGDKQGFIFCSMRTMPGNAFSLNRHPDGALFAEA